MWGAEMLICGIDIGKNKHEACIIDQEGRQRAKTLHFTNTTAGAESLLGYITENNAEKDVAVVGMEATGHYWMSLYCFLFDAGFQVNVINPIQSDAIRNLILRKTRNDAKGNFLIAEIIRIGQFSKTDLADEDILSMRQLLEMIELLERQLVELETEIELYLVKLDTQITTCPGVGKVLGAVILSEIGDITRFPKPKKLVAFVGIDPSVRQSGEFVGTHNKMSKRGSPHLRRAIWLAATVAAFHAPVLSAFYQKKRSEGKHHYTAIGAVARKLTFFIYAVLRDNKPYAPNC